MDIYRIQKREMSSDVIERNVGTADKPKWAVYICPSGGRFDNIAHELCNYLNNSGMHTPTPINKPKS